MTSHDKTWQYMRSLLSIMRLHSHFCISCLHVTFLTAISYTDQLPTAGQSRSDCCCIAWTILGTFQESGHDMSSLILWGLFEAETGLSDETRGNCAQS